MNRSDDSQVMADFLNKCKGKEKVRMDDFIGAVF